MTEQILDDVRRILLGLLFVIAFGWMAAQLVPGESGAIGEQQLAVDASRAPG